MDRYRVSSYTIGGTCRIYRVSIPNHHPYKLYIVALLDRYRSGVAERNGSRYIAAININSTDHIAAISSAHYYGMAGTIN